MPKVIEAENKIIGFALVQEKETSNISCLKTERYLYILDLVIAEEYRNKGYGGFLLEVSKEWGGKRNLGFLRLSVFPDNHDGIKFYEIHELKTTMQTMECKLGRLS